MKTETSIKGKKFIYNIPKPEILDDFWKDCFEQKEKKYLKNISNAKYIQKNNKIFINIDNENTKTNSYSKKKNKKTNSSSKLYEPKNKSNFGNNSHHKTKINQKNQKYLIKIYKKHPSVVEEMKNEEIKKLKCKNALNRCLGLYSYGLELQKNLQMNKENNELQKRKNDISLCTFKPKINKKILFLDDNKIIEGKYNRLYNNNNTQNNNNDINNINKNPPRQKTKSMEHARNDNNYINKKNDFEECTFKPKLVKNPSQVEKILKLRRKKNKSISEKRENEEFILRYTKARDEYLIKRFIKLDKKDDSYDNSLISLTKRLCNQQYKNYLNVNNTICLFGETINTNTFINSSIADFRGLTIANTVPEKKKKKINYIIGLRKNLHSIDLNETETEQ